MDIGATVGQGVTSYHTSATQQVYDGNFLSCNNYLSIKSFTKNYMKY